MCHFNNARMSGHSSRGFGAAQPNWGHFAKHFGGWQRDHQGRVPVNVRERKDWYEIFVYAPGRSKDAFQVNINDDVLSVRFQSADASDGDNWLHREYGNPSFERQFLLNGKVDTSGITARYNEGVLELTLPKLPGSEGQAIAVG